MLLISFDQGVSPSMKNVYENIDSLVTSPGLHQTMSRIGNFLPMSSILLLELLSRMVNCQSCELSAIVVILYKTGKALS